MQENPNVIAELSSHTDSRASFEYNNMLSSNRANAAVDYIVMNGGILPGRILARGYGEYRLTNKCSDGVNCSEAEHQMNRRTEFKVIAISQPNGRGQFNPSKFEDGEIINLNALPDYFFEPCNLKVSDSPAEIKIVENQKSDPVQVADRVQVKDIVQASDPVQVNEPVTKNQPVQVIETVQEKDPVQVSNPVQVDVSVEEIDSVQTTDPVQLAETVQEKVPVQVNDPVQTNQTVQKSVTTEKQISTTEKEPIKDTGKKYHVVMVNETLYHISIMNDISVEELKELNNLSDNTIIAGQKLRIQ
jgi:LysM repeat protein